MSNYPGEGWGDAIHGALEYLGILACVLAVFFTPALTLLLIWLVSK